MYTLASITELCKASCINRGDAVTPYIHPNRKKLVGCIWNGISIVVYSTKATQSLNPLFLHKTNNKTINNKIINHNICEIIQKVLGLLPNSVMIFYTGWNSESCHYSGLLWSCHYAVLRVTVIMPLLRVTVIMLLYSGSLWSCHYAVLRVTVIMLLYSGSLWSCHYSGSHVIMLLYSGSLWSCHYSGSHVIMHRKRGSHHGIRLLSSLTRKPFRHILSLSPHILWTPTSWLSHHISSEHPHLGLATTYPLNTQIWA